MDHFKNVYWIAIAGLSGAFTSISLHKEKKTPTEIVIFIISGMLTAAFVAPLISRWAGLTGEESISAVSFLTGACWQFVINRATGFFKNAKVPGVEEAQ